MRGTKEVVGNLRGFDDYVNLVLDDAVEYTPDPLVKGKVIKTVIGKEILLNGNQIAILVPGSSGPPDDSLAAQQQQHEATAQLILFVGRVEWDRRTLEGEVAAGRWGICPARAADIVPPSQAPLEQLWQAARLRCQARQIGRAHV